MYLIYSKASQKKFVWSLAIPNVGIVNTIIRNIKSSDHAHHKIYYIHE